MYFIVNTSNKDIVISDMGLTIRVKQGLDLDNNKIKLLKSYNESNDLKIAIQKGIIKIAGSDKKKKNKEEKSSPANNSNDLEQIRNIIKQELKNHNSNSDILKLLEETKKMIETSNHSSGINNNDSVAVGNNTIAEENDIDESTLNKIHAKRVNEIIKKSENNINDENNEVIDDPSINDNISELQNLL